MYRHKAQYIFYSVHKNFISEFKKLMFGHSTSRLSLEVATFLSRKCSYEMSEEFTVIILFGSEERPFLLPLYVLDKLFVGEMCIKYKTWAHFFHDKRKNQFIPIPWKIGKFTVKHITHLN
jgi:hypothetical protein